MEHMLCSHVVQGQEQLHQPPPQGDLVQMLALMIEAKVHNVSFGLFMIKGSLPSAPSSSLSSFAGPLVHSNLQSTGVQRWDMKRREEAWEALG